MKEREEMDIRVAFSYDVIVIFSLPSEASRLKTR